MMKDDNLPLVSVIIPTYNRKEFCSEALKSVYKQVYRPIEIIVIDDGSKDDTESFVNGFQERFNDKKSFLVKYIYQENKGPSAARNNGFEHSNGEFIHYLDSDDTLEPDLYSIVIDKMIRNNADQCHFGISSFTSDIEKEKNTKYIPEKDPDILRNFFLNKLLGFGVSFIRSKKLIEKVGNWDVNMNIAEDRDFCFRCLVHSENTVIINKELYNFRQHGEEHLNSNRKSRKRWEQRLYGERKIAGLIKEYNLPEKYVHIFKANCFNLAVNLYAWGYKDLGKEFGILAKSLNLKKNTSVTKKLNLIWFLGPIASGAYVFMRKLKVRIAEHI